MVAWGGHEVRLARDVGDDLVEIDVYTRLVAVCAVEDVSRHQNKVWVGRVDRG